MLREFIIAFKANVIYRDGSIDIRPKDRSEYMNRVWRLSYIFKGISFMLKKCRNLNIEIGKKTKEKRVFKAVVGLKRYKWDKKRCLIAVKTAVEKHGNSYFKKGEIYESLKSDPGRISATGKQVFFLHKFSTNTSEMFAEFKWHCTYKFRKLTILPNDAMSINKDIELELHNLSSKQTVSTESNFTTFYDTHPYSICHIMDNKKFNAYIWIYGANHGKASTSPWII